MAKSLKDILAGSNASKVETPDLTNLAMSPEGNKDGIKFAAKHKIQKHADRAGNGDDIYQATNIKHTKYNRQDQKVYEETEELDEISSKKAWDAADAADARSQGDRKVGYPKGRHERGSDEKNHLIRQRDKFAAYGDKKAKKEKSVKEEAEEELEEKYMGFKKLMRSIAAKGGAKDPGAVAAAIGRKKYGKAKFQKAAAAGKKLKEDSHCNHTNEGTYCEAHGMKACPSDNDMGKREKAKGKKLLLDRKKIDEAIINEVAPPNPKIESWIKANKERFIKEYGKEKGMKVLYGKAWDMHNENSSNPATNTDYAGPGAAGWATGRLDTGTL